MSDPITTLELNGLLHMAVEKHGIDPNQTYVEFTWWDHVFRPLTDHDCNRQDSSFIMVFGDSLCNFWNSVRLGGKHVPCGFYIASDEVWPDRVVHRPTKLSWLLDNKFMLEFKHAKFLFTGSPVNYFVGIDPFKTRVYRNWANETILCFYAADGGRMKPISAMTPDHIKFIDDGPIADVTLKFDGN